MASDQLVNRERLLAQFGLLTAADVAALFGISVKTLQNRPLHRQPAFSKVGPERLYHSHSVADFLNQEKVETKRQYNYTRKPVPVALPPAKPKRGRPRRSESRVQP